MEENNGQFVEKFANVLRLLQQDRRIDVDMQVGWCMQ